MNCDAPCCRQPAEMRMKRLAEPGRPAWTVDLCPDHADEAIVVATQMSLVVVQEPITKR